MELGLDVCSRELEGSQPRSKRRDPQERPCEDKRKIWVASGGLARPRRFVLTWCRSVVPSRWSFGVVQLGADARFYSPLHSPSAMLYLVTAALSLTTGLSMPTRMPRVAMQAVAEPMSATKQMDLREPVFPEVCEYAGITLSRYVLEMAQANPDKPELVELVSVMTSVERACKTISKLVRTAPIEQASLLGLEEGDGLDQRPGRGAEEARRDHEHGAEERAALLGQDGRARVGGGGRARRRRGRRRRRTSTRSTRRSSSRRARSTSPSSTRSTARRTWTRTSRPARSSASTRSPRAARSPIGEDGTVQDEGLPRRDPPVGQQARRRRLLPLLGRDVVRRSQDVPGIRRQDLRLCIIVQCYSVC